MKRIYINSWIMRFFTVLALLGDIFFCYSCVIVDGVSSPMEIVMCVILICVAVYGIIDSWSVGVFINKSKNRICFAVKERGTLDIERFVRVLDSIRRIDVRWEKDYSCICFIVTHYNGYKEEIRHTFWRTLDIYIRFCANRLSRTFAKLYPPE